MFDVGFSELVLIGIIALVVLGPERLPKVARTAGLWAGRARRFLSNIKADIDRELKAEELRQIMEKQAKSTGIHEIIEETRTAVSDIKNVTTSTLTGTSPAAAPGTAPSPVAEEAAPKPTVASPEAHERE